MATSSAQLTRMPAEWQESHEDHEDHEDMATFDPKAVSTETAADKTASWKLPAITKWSAGP
ncbi:MAG: hypothetical protein ABJC62_00610 [Frankiaceae bacterium]